MEKEETDTEEFAEKRDIVEITTESDVAHRYAIRMPDGRLTGCDPPPEPGVKLTKGARIKTLETVVFQLLRRVEALERVNDERRSYEQEQNERRG